MKFFTAITAMAAAMPSLVAAAPSAKPPVVAHKFLLQTKVISGSESFNGLFVAPYHTGAGENDVALVKSRKGLPPAFLNNTHLQFLFNEGDQPYYPWGTTLAYEVGYAAWQPVEINTGYGQKGFLITNGTLQQKLPKDEQAFNGWRVCEWWHSNTPQLFYNYVGYDAKPISTCADVNLVPVALNTAAH